MLLIAFDRVFSDALVMEYCYRTRHVRHGGGGRGVGYTSSPPWFSLTARPDVPTYSAFQESSHDTLY